MPRQKKNALPEPDPAKMREVEAYAHDDKKRANNPPVGMARHDTAEEKRKTYQFDPHLDPTLQWAGKAEGMTFDVLTSSIHIHESIKPENIIARVMREYSGTEEGQLPEQIGLLALETPADRMRRRREAVEFYQHGVDWTNRLIAGDSLVIMNSLLEKEGMAGQVQMVYIDPPYGIKYGSNFQPFIDQRDVKDRKDEDLTQEPETIKAFRDTWELGIHSYLTYLRNRLLLVKELLSDSGSVFVQISEENVHHVREICDEIFGRKNCVSFITFFKTSSQTSGSLASTTDYIIWYSKNIEKLKYRQLYLKKDITTDKSGVYRLVELPDGERRPMTKEELLRPLLLPDGSRIFRKDNMTSQSGGETTAFPVTIQGKTYSPGRGFWKTNETGMQRLIRAGRIFPAENSLCYVRYLDDFPVYPITNLWTDTGTGSFTDDKIYVVQTGTKTIARCMLMTTDPGDLVLDITCGSGTTAYVAEQWGRRWITCDTSRVAVTLAKQRLMTATFDYYQLKHPAEGVGGGFEYKTVPHITLKSIANGTPPERETLYDQPETDRRKVRVTGPFTVEALPAPAVMPLDEIDDDSDENSGAKQSDWREQLRATGILGRNGDRLEFNRVEELPGARFLQAEAETKEPVPRRAVVCFGGEATPLDSRMVELALDEAETLRPAPKLLIFAAFQFDPEAARLIEETNWPGMDFLKVQMNTDLMTEDLKKKRSSDQSFWFVGQPDVKLIADGRSKNLYKVRVNGFDYYNVKTGRVESGDAERIVMWMLDTAYDGMCIEPKQVFFPMGGKKDGWNKLAKTLRAEIRPELMEKYAGTESLPFRAEPNSQIAVKIIDDRGIESLKVIRIEGERS